MMKSRNMSHFLAAVIGTGVLLLSPALVTAAEKKPAAAVYWMNVATENFSMPGMEEGASDGGGMFGRMAGMPQFGPKKSLRLELLSPRSLPATPEAGHDIPPGQKMGRQLPLEIPAREKAAHEYDEKAGKIEKPKMRMLIYWGCGETIGKGQPKILDTANMSMTDFGKAMSGLSGRVSSAQNPPRPRAGWNYAEWPNRTNSAQVPKDSSLLGDHLVHGNYTPDIKFQVGEHNDFMAPVVFTSVTGNPTESIPFAWKKIPAANGYFAQAIGHNEKTGETIFWTSSAVADTGFGLLDYLPPADVRRLIKDKVVMTPETTNCAVPKGIFSEAKGAMLQFIGYGDELNLAYPPRPKDPKAEWNPVWTLKLRNKSTGFTTLGSDDGNASRRSERQRKTQQEDPGEERQQKEEGGGRKVLRGIFGF
ncbi:MAG: hypothetical protein C0402_10475 [Thermodesulfovibrio sp.]|nr:hypothetical protein [Thermodesulfovibrio sp.]